jgi:hypothetical protein
VVKEGRRELRDQLYLTGAAYQDSDRLRYDKQLLGNWLREEFRASWSRSRGGGARLSGRA